MPSETAQFITAPSMTIVRGLPGSGKTTFAKYWASIVGPEAVMIAADDYFMVDGEYRFNMERIGAAHFDCQNRTIASLADRRHPVIHNTFVKPRELKPYLDIADDMRVETLWIIDVGNAGLSAPELAARNTHGVPVDTIHRMADHYADQYGLISRARERGFEHAEYMKMGEPFPRVVVNLLKRELPL